MPHLSPIPLADIKEVSLKSNGVEYARKQNQKEQDKAY